MEPHSAAVCILGSPNAGKSTLLNRILGKKVSVVSEKPQTTRSRILGILTRGDRQLIFMDTPGIGRPIRTHAARLNRLAEEAGFEADIILFLIDIKKGVAENERNILKKLKEYNKPVVAAINKMDLSTNEAAMPLAQALFSEWGIQEIFPVSAKLGYNLDKLLDKLMSMAPENPFLYGENEVTTQTAEQMISEYVREQIFMNADKELPYSITVRVDSLKDTPEGGLAAEAVILVENPRHRRILIGEKGAFIRNLRQNAARRLKTYFNKPVKLALWIKLLKDLSNRPSD